MPNQLIGAAQGHSATLECHVESSPRPLVQWFRTDGVTIIPTGKYSLEEERMGEAYRMSMRLKISDLDKKDFGSYKCMAKNGLGEKEGLVRLYGKHPLHLYRHY